MQTLGSLVRVFVALILSSSLISAAAYAKEHKVGYVDVEVISKEAAAFKDLNTQLPKKRDELQAIVNEYKNKLDEEIREFREKSPVLSHEVSQEARKVIEEKAKELEHLVKMSESFIEENYKRSAMEVGEASRKVIDAVAAKHGVDTIVSKACILYPHDLTKTDLKDITKEVMDGINKAMPSYTVVFVGEDKLPIKKHEKNPTKDAKKAAAKPANVATTAPATPAAPPAKKAESKKSSVSAK